VIRFSAEGRDFSFFKQPRLNMEPSLLLDGKKGAVPVVSKRPKLKANHLPQTDADIKNSLSYTSYPSYDVTTR
jgi:hypothetical protein